MNVAPSAGILRGEEVVAHVRDVFPVEHQRRARHGEQVRALRRDRRRPLARSATRHRGSRCRGRACRGRGPSCADGRRCRRSAWSAGSRRASSSARRCRASRTARARCRRTARSARPGYSASPRTDASSAGQPVDHRRPGLAEVGRAEDVRREVAVAVRVERHVRRARATPRTRRCRRRTCRSSRR